MNKYIKGCGIFILLIIITGSIILGGKIPFKDQMPIYDGLRNTSSIIFAVMGAWIALLYPSMLSKAFGKQPYEQKTSDIDDIKKLFRPLVYSTIILMIVIVMSFIVPLAKQINALVTYKEIFRTISFTIISTLSCMQLWSLIITLTPSDSIKDDLDKLKQREELLKRMRPGKQANVKK